MKQTAVEWLFDELKKFGTHIPKIWFEQAKEKEKIQIIDAFKRGAINEMNGIEEIDSEQYYKKNFK